MTPADNVVVMGTFTPIELFKTGDSIKVTTTLTVGTRTTNLGANSLNTQLRIGLFDGPGAPGAVVVDDTPNTGFIIEYSNLAAGGLIRRQDNTGQVNPFVGPTNIGNGVQDTGGDAIRGANLGPVLFELMLTRNGSLINLSGTISGTDSSNGNPYSSSFTATNQLTAPNGFIFDRVGFFFGANVDGPNGTLNNVNITAVIPEPGSVIVFALVMAAGGAGWWKSNRRARPQPA
jgi:hypothetical protein